MSGATYMVVMDNHNVSRRVGLVWREADVAVLASPRDTAAGEDSAKLLHAQGVSSQHLYWQAATARMSIGFIYIYIYSVFLKKVRVVQEVVCFRHFLHSFDKVLTHQSWL